MRFLKITYGDKNFDSDKCDCDGQAGLQQLAGDATMLFYMSEEAQEGRDAFKEKRKPNFKKYPRLP